MSEKKRGRPKGHDKNSVDALEKAEGLYMAVRTTLHDLTVAEIAINQDRPDTAKRLIVEARQTLERASR